MDKPLWKYTTYTNKNIPYLFNTDIIEYDMKDAGLSLSREFKLISEKEIDRLLSYPKMKQTVELGKLQRDNGEFNKALTSSFEKARQMFIEQNDLSDNDVISIKKDALIVKKRCDIQQFGTYINFRPKHTYSSFIQLENKLEFYYDTETLDVKGISDEKLKLHDEYMIKFIKLFCEKMETVKLNQVLSWMRVFIDNYKRRTVDLGYYRTFDNSSYFSLIDDDTIYENCLEEDRERIDISYNYFNILLKFIQIPL